MSQLVQAKWSRRLENWARWILSGGGSGKGKSSLLDFGSTPHWSDAFSPQPLIGEAIDTDDLMQRLAVGTEKDRNQYAALKCWHTWAGTPRDWAATLGIHVDTLYDRVHAGYYRLNDLDLLRKRATTKPPKPDGEIKCMYPPQMMV